MRAAGVLPISVDPTSRQVVVLLARSVYPTQSPRIQLPGEEQAPPADYEYEEGYSDFWGAILPNMTPGQSALSALCK